jgi:hypothetical protein
MLWAKCHSRASWWVDEIRWPKLRFAALVEGIELVISIADAVDAHRLNEGAS